MNLSLVGDDGSGSDSVQCITDLGTCCTNTVSFHRGDWVVKLIECHSLVISMRLVELRELNYVVVTMLTHQLVSITVIFQLKLSMMVDNSVRATVYVGLYTASGGMFYNNTGAHKCIHFCRRFVYVDVCNNSIL